jgi:SAM-dependent methyltransferase
MNQANLPIKTLRFQEREYLIKKLMSGEIRNKRFLEIGCGAGDFSYFLAENGLHGVTLDFSDKAVKITEAKLKPFKNCIRVIKKDFLDFEDKEGFDFIFAFEVLEHIKNDILVLNKIFHLLNKGGIFIFSVPAKKKRWSILDEWAGHYRRYEKEEIREKLKNAFFNIETIWLYGFPLDYITYFIERFIIKTKSGKGEKDKLKASQASGVNRDSQKKFSFFYHKFFTYPFIFTQKLFLNSSLGLGFIGKAKKDGRTKK